MRQDQSPRASVAHQVTMTFSGRRLANQSAAKPRKPRKPKVEHADTDYVAVEAAHAAAATQQVQVIESADGTIQLPENMEVMVGQDQDNQTILVSADGTIVQTGDQDMIVVIQSEDFDQSQGGSYMVVDPSQLQQVVGADGVPVTLVEAPTTTTTEGATKILAAAAATEEQDEAATAAAAIVNGEAEKEKV